VTTLGLVMMALAFVAALVSIGSLLLGDRAGEREGESVTNIGYLATFAITGGLTLAVVVLVTAFFRSDFSFLYVIENRSTDVSSLAWLYKLSGMWAGREGSLLFWAWLLSLFAGYVAYKRLQVTDRLSNMALMVTNCVQGLFLASLFIDKNNPFKAVTVLADGTIQQAGQLLRFSDGSPQTINALAMNPLLQHWAMILHPPTLFLGYAGLTIPFAFAIAALIVNDPSKRWVELCDRITVFSWLFLGIGIGLGAIWAYVVLGWGGYWAWDPVENASLLPWLTGVGLIHSFTVYRRRDGFKKWSVLMATVTFVLVILGTFITRSGVISSVHAFEKDPLSLYLFLFIMLAALAAGIVGLLVRSQEFRGNDEFDSMVSRESAYYFNNVLMLVAAAVVAGLTLSPAFGGATYGRATYDAISRPVGILYVAILVFCPILSWRRTEGATLWDRVKIPFVAAVVLAGVLLLTWWTTLLPNYQIAAGAIPNVDHAEAIIGLIVAAFAIVMPIWLFIDGTRKRAAARGEGAGTAFVNLITKARSQSGGYLTHLGIGIILVGLIGSTMYVQDVKKEIPNTPGSKFTVAGYTFVFKGLDQRTLPNQDVTANALFDVQRNGKTVGTSAPGLLQFAIQGQTRLNADVHVEPLRDVFTIFEGTTQAGNLSMEIKINPLISWTWLGFVLMILGTTIAAFPKQRNLA